MNIDKILPLVQRPARYINSEWNSHEPKKDAPASICFCFPDIYEVGASNLGIEILYHLVNETTPARAERCYCPAKDLEDKLRGSNSPLFSLESKTPLKEFDIVGFSLHHELCAGNLLNMLDLAGIPKLTAERTEVFPLIIGGGPVTANPEPFADFFDAFVLGEGEDAIVEILKSISTIKSQIPNPKLTSETEKMEQRKKLLLEMAKIPGVYVPSLYDVSYNDDGTIKAVKPLRGAPARVVKRIVKLNDAFFPAKQMVPFIQTVHNRLNVEIARGCPRMCRFCQAARYYYPWRQRSEENVLKILDEGLPSTGYEEVSFSSLSSTDYKGLSGLLGEVQKRFGQNKIGVTLPSLRCDRFSLKVAGDLSHNKRSSLTFAPEAGSERLRHVLGKDISEKNILETLSIAARMGWKLVKLYFMIGLPTETDEDIDAIIKLVRAAKKQNPSLNFNVTVSPLVPKSQTPFQWVAMERPGKIVERLKKLERSLPASVKGHFVEASALEAVLARGDRKLSRVILKAWEKGCRFDQWREHSRFDLWQEAFKECAIDEDFYAVRERKAAEILPWDHLQFSTEKDALLSEYNKIFEPFAPKEEGDAPAAPIVKPPEFKSEKTDFKSVRRLRLRFSRKGDARFLSHLEQIDVFRRVFRRAGLPVAYSMGFSPQVKASFGPAISVGYESESEYVELELIRQVEPSEIIERLDRALPRGFKTMEAKKIPLFFPSLDSLLNVAVFRIEAAAEDESIKAFLSRPEIIVEKVKENKVIRIDAKPLIREMKSMQGGIYPVINYHAGDSQPKAIAGTKAAEISNGIYLELLFGPKKNVKPERIIQKLLGLGEEETKLLQVCRTGFLIEKKDGTILEP